MLLERRLGPNAVALDNQALVSQMTHPTSLAQALLELNFGQLLLLRWLGTRPNLEATWSDLIQAIGDRLTPELRDAYLLDLRLWGLADYHPAQRGGFFATYPAVIAHLPTRRGVRAQQQLAGLTSDMLPRIAGALGLKNVPSRKEERLRLIMGTLAEAGSCRAVVERLSPEARSLFAWVREHDGWVTAQQMQERSPLPRTIYAGGYGLLDRFWHPVAKGAKLDPLSELVRCALVLPVSAYPGSWYGPSAYAIPEEVEMAYSGRTLLDSGPLQPPPLVSAEGVTGTVPNPTSLMRDVIHLVGFVAAGRCEWRQDGGPYKRSLVALGKILGSPNGDYPEMLWEMAAAAQLVLPTFRPGAGFQATTGIDATPRQLLDGLLLGWIEAGRRAAQPGVAAGVAEAARVRLLQLLQIVPADVWILKVSIEEWLRFHWPVIFRSDLQPLHLAVPDPGIASLGNLLLARGSTSDGLEAVMIPATHQQLLTPAEPDAPADSSGTADGALPPWDESWVVQPDRSIVAPPNASPHALLDIWKVAQLESNQGASVFRLTADSIAAALNRNLTPAEIRTLLEKRSRVPLPPTVERLIDDQGKRYGRIKVGAAQTYVKVDDPALLAELRRDKRLQKLDWRDVAPGVAFVGGRDPSAVLDTLRKAGYLPVMDQARPTKVVPSAGASAPARRRKPPNRESSEANGILRLARTALREERLLYVTWSDGADLRDGELEIIDLHGREIHANNLDDGEEVLVSVDAIVEAELGDPIDDDIDLSFLDE